MFKKKTALPARPSIPSREEIIDDLASAGPEDAVFKYASECSVALLSGDKPISETSCEQNKYESKIQDEHKATSEAYMKVDSFVEKVNYLERYSLILEQQKKNLKELEEDLKQDLIHIEAEFQKSSKPSL